MRSLGKAEHDRATSSVADRIPGLVLVSTHER
jgi:hypothetical protein